MPGSPEGMGARKAAVREHLLALRRSLPMTHREEATDRVWARLRDLPLWERATSVGFYVSTGSEVGTRDALREELAAEAREVAAPVTDPSSRELTFRRVGALEDLERGSLGILEPTTGERVEPGAMDVVVVPGVGFDEAGHRLGRGGGSYDAFLTEFPGTSVGLAFDEQVMDTIPVGPHDEPVDIVVTPTRVLPRGRRVE